MFRDVPECSVMFHVPGFIDGRKTYSGHEEWDRSSGTKQQKSTQALKFFSHHVLTRFETFSSPSHSMGLRHEISFIRTGFCHPIN